jgi:protease-4
MDPQNSPQGNYVNAQYVDPRSPIRVIVEQPRGSWIGRLIRWGVSILLLLAVLGMIYGESDSLKEEHHSLSETATKKIAIIKIEGTIMGSEGYVKDQIEKVRDDKDVKAVVIRIDSPGGTVTGSDYIYHHLKQLATKKQIPLVVSMGGIAASGGYYVAMAAGGSEKAIYAEPTTWTGSIGVIIPHYDFTKLMHEWDIEDDSIASHPLKMMGSPTRDLPEPYKEEEAKILKGLVDSSFEGFKEIVLASRPGLRADQAKQDIVFTGRIFTAKQAQENLLVDQLGFIEDAIDRALELANLDRESTRVVEYKKPVGALDVLLFGSQSQGHARQLDLAALADLTVPRPYYLCTWMPVLAGLSRP